MKDEMLAVSSSSSSPAVVAMVNSLTARSVASSEAADAPREARAMMATAASIRTAPKIERNTGVDPKIKVCARYPKNMDAAVYTVALIAAGHSIDPAVLKNDEPMVVRKATPVQPTTAQGDEDVATLNGASSTRAENGSRKVRIAEKNRADRVR
eukprot:TRINITY_DN10607_c0_g1_i3.p2 TRINITY_DN10607_c0_g1~~TRINITY_DN10607_c0_g1_i3.p2  ORF type:complete len:154 (-),score=33.30 TRINITY_DN10607_c0_g1_i3:453-914(-)